METDGKFYLGRLYDPEQREVTTEPLLYDPDDLTTHAVVVGMTGSGKTGLCIDLLEEAALNNYPALMIDPKGDITNALLHFPELLPEDFLPWVNADEARRDEKTVEQAAEGAANLWRKGLGKWDIGPERIQALKDAAQFTIFTPGSDAGIPVSILASLEAPQISWDDNQELLREKISSTVTALLGLVGLRDIDPVRSREHILLANIFERAWSEGRDLDLGELILQTQNPPFEKLGVFDVDMFFPEKDRFELAILLNNILAAPAFQTWIQGQPLDIAELLYSADGRPRHSVFYIAHLTDEERMFFVTLLYSAIESWMRAQSGTSSLRAIVYFDEVFGYLPPVSNPPSKEIMLRMLKQSRAFGVSHVLVTQNPVDVDYKGLSNAGTWCIGKLQTDQDKQRLLDGLEGAMSGALDRRVYDRMISSLDKRVFLLHNVHERAPALLHTRWAMNYLAGPLTRIQIPALNKLAGVGGVPGTGVRKPSTLERDALQAAPATSAAAGSKPADSEADPESEFNRLGSTTRPSFPARVDEYFLPANLSLTRAFDNAGQRLTESTRNLGLLYRPTLLAQAQVRFLNRKYNLDHEIVNTAFVPEPDRKGRVRWDDFIEEPLEEKRLDPQPDPRARFVSINAPYTNAKIMSTIKRDFLDWVYHESESTVRANEVLKVYAGPEVSPEEFREMCSEEAREKRDGEMEKLRDRYEKKIDAIEARLEREKRELKEDQDDLSQRKMEEWGSHAETVLSLFGGRRRSVSSSLSKRRMTSKAKADVEESLDAIEDFEEDIEELEAELTQEVEEISNRWGEIAGDIIEIPVRPYKKDVLLEMFGVAWLPNYVVVHDGELVELPGYKIE
ncbi:MAG: DUF87 domain-containing protein [Chloroflexota bacterium]|nr:DUF87 domain-containing protein [Chloroflexota bacterium]